MGIGKGFLIPLLSNMQRVKFVGEFIPSSLMEYISDEGENIRCSFCGDVKYRKTYSSIFGRYRWNAVHKDDSCGCSCMRKEWDANKARRDKFRKATGFDVASTYNMRMWLNSVPEALRTARADDRWYYQGDDGLRTSGEAESFRQLMLFSEITGMGAEPSTRNLYIHGPEGSLKTSMLCCARNMALDKGIPAILTTPTQIADMSRNDSKYFDVLYDVDLLLVDDIGKLRINDRFSDVLENLFEYRDRAEHMTFYASGIRPERLIERGYSKSLADTIKGTIKDSLAMMEFTGG